jgi:hypothetical protein
MDFLLELFISIFYLVYFMSGIRGQIPRKLPGRPTSEIFWWDLPTHSEASQLNFQPGRTIGRYRNIIYIAGTTKLLAEVAIQPTWLRD